MQVTIDNRDTIAHIDTYQVFTGESFEEYELEYLREIHEDSTLDYDSFEWSYDHDAIVKELAIQSIDIIENELRHSDIDVIESIELDESFSPRFYNYTTDGYKMNVTCNAPRLHEYMVKHYDAILEIAKSHRAYESDITDDDRVYATVVHIINNVLEEESYTLEMFEHVHEIYSNNTEIEKK